MEKSFRHITRCCLLRIPIKNDWEAQILFTVQVLQGLPVTEISQVYGVLNFSQTSPFFYFAFELKTLILRASGSKGLRTVS